MIRRRRLRPDRPCPFCGSSMQYSESGRYAEWRCIGTSQMYGPEEPMGGTTVHCQGHAEIPLKWQYSA